MRILLSVKSLKSLWSSESGGTAFWRGKGICIKLRQFQIVLQMNRRPFGQLWDWTASGQEWEGCTLSPSPFFVFELLVYGPSWWLQSYHMVVLCYMLYVILCLNIVTKHIWSVMQRLLSATFCCEGCTGPLCWWFDYRSLLTITFAFDNLFFCTISCLTSY